MSNLFTSVSVKKPKRNVFNLSHEVKLSTNMSYLTPILCQDVVPGDKFKVNANVLVRLAPMLSPIYHRINCYVHYFFVPNRIVWNEWEDFVTGGPDGKSNPVFPRFDLAASSYAQLSQPRGLADYLGVGSSSGTPGSGSIQVSALPFRAYQMIYNEYYRDENLIDPVEFSLDSGLIQSTDPDFNSLTSIRRRAWEKDYFTSALPWAQRGEEVLLPLHGSAPVVLSDNSRSQTVVQTPSGDPVGVKKYLRTGEISNTLRASNTDESEAVYANLDPNGTLSADLTQASATSINELRRAHRLQEWLEKMARGGSRYIEQIAAHFGVRSSDARLQRPEFLSGGRAQIAISEVLQTSSTDDVSPLAQLAGHGIGAMASNQFKRSFEEHGYIIGIMSILPRTNYQQGLPRHFSKFDKFDYYWPSFAHLGEQPIYNKEIYADVADLSTADGVFGYTPRYAEYKYQPSRVAGEFKTSLNYWHLGRIFSSQPNLNGDFVSSDDIERIFAVNDSGDTDKFWCKVDNNIMAVRPMPKFGTPTI